MTRTEKSPGATVSCPACGSEQPAGESDDGRCVVCGKNLPPAPSRPREPTGGAAAGESAARRSGRVTLAPEPAPEGGGAPPIRAREMDQIRMVEKRISMLPGLIPGFGVWWALRNPGYSPREKTLLGALSLALAIALGAAAWLALPKTADRLDGLATRVERDVRVLADLVADYRDEHGRLPGDESWRRAIDNADPRFFDPWSRPYRYGREEGGFSIGTYGRDGAPGGQGEDADRFVFTPEGAPAEAR